MEVIVHDENNTKSERRENGAAKEKKGGCHARYLSRKAERPIRSLLKSAIAATHSEMPTGSMPESMPTKPSRVNNRQTGISRMLVMHGMGKSTSSLENPYPFARNTVDFWRQ